MTLDRSTFAREISTSLEQIEAAMEDLDRLKPLANQALEAKREAHAAVDWLNGRLARLLEALYAIEGHDVLAAKVRPSSHRAKKGAAEASGGVADGRKMTAASRQAARGEMDATVTETEAAAPPSSAAPPDPVQVEPRRAAPSPGNVEGGAARSSPTRMSHPGEETMKELVGMASSRPPASVATARAPR